MTEESDQFEENEAGEENSFTYADTFDFNATPKIRSLILIQAKATELTFQIS